MRNLRNARKMRHVAKIMSRAVCDAVFPKRCAICDEPEATGLCPACAYVPRVLTGALCMKCGKALPTERACEEYCKDCENIDHAFDRGFSVFYYPSVAQSLYRFKYAGRQEYASFYADAFVRLYGGLPKGVAIDALVPVPLSKRRRRARGYNQAEVFARALSKRTNVPMASDLLRREKDTKPQKELDYYGRRNNLKNAFIVRKNDVLLKSVALVDDIYTTGSTADEIAALLKRYGARNVYVFTSAIGYQST